MNRRIIFLILSIVFFLGAVTFYINRVTIPKDLRTIILKESRQFLGREIQLKKIGFNPLTGLTLEGITIFEEDSQDIFATIDRVRVHLLYWSLLKKQKIIISSLELKGASLNLIHYAENEWNYSDILKRRSQKTQQTRKIYLSRLIFSDGYIHLTNLEDGFQFSEIFEDLDVTINLSVTKGIEFKTSTRYANKQHTLEIFGNANPLKNQLSAKIKSSGLAVKSYLDLFQPSLPVELKDVSIKDMDVSVLLRKHLVDVQGNMTLGAVELNSPQSKLLFKSLTLHDFKFGFHDGEYLFQGQMNADAPSMSVTDKTYAADFLSAQIHNTSIRGGIIAFTGSLSAVRAAILSGQQWNFYGDIQLNSLAFSRGANTFKASTALDIKNSQFSVGDKIRMDGDFLSPGLTIINSAETTTVKGDLYANNFFYSWPTNKELRSQLAFNNTRVVANSKTQWTVESDLKATSLQLKLPRNNQLSSDIDGKVSAYFTPIDQNFKITSTYQLSNASFHLANGMNLVGNPTGTVVVTSKSVQSPNIPYKGTLEFKDAVLNKTRFGTVDHIQGTVDFENNRARTSNLNLQALGMPALLTGNLEDFTSPSLDITVHVKDFDLSKSASIIPDILSKHSLSLTGIAPWLSISYRGPVSTTAGSDISFEAQITDASLTSAKFNKTATGLNGGIRYEEKKLFWQDLTAVYNNKTFHLTGSMTPSTQPLIETDIESDDFKLKTRLEFTSETINFHQLMGRFKKAVFNVHGSQKTIAGGGTMFDLTGEADLDLKELPEIFPRLPEPIKKCALSGMTNIKGSFKGDPSHWQDWQFDLTGASPQFSIWGLNIQNMKFNAVQKNNLLKPFHVWGEFYEGELNFVASLDTAKKELPFDIVLRVLNSDLNKFRVDTPLKKQLLKGTLSMTAILNGQLTDMKTMSGKGGIEIKDGMLWELDLLKGLGGILLIPEYKDIVFTQAGMNFLMAKGVMSTDNIQLLGPSLNLFGKGTLDFNLDQSLNLTLSPDFNSTVIAESSSLKKGTTAIISQTEKFMSVDVTGTLTKPKYKVNNAPVKILQKTGGVILENVSQFFQNIF